MVLGQALALQQREDAGVGAGPLGVDGLQLRAVGVDRVLRVGHGGRVGPDGRVLEELHAGVVGGHAGVEGVRPVGAVGRGEVALQVQDVAGLDAVRDVGAGVLPVQGVGRADDHVHVAGADDRVDRDELDVVRGRVADRRAEAGRRLRVHDDRLGALVHQVLDLLVLQAGVGGGEQRAEQLDVHLRGVLLLVVDVGGPEGGVVVGQVDADRDLARTGRGGGGARAGRAGCAAGGAGLLELLELQAATSRPAAASATVPIRRLFALMALSSHVSECYGLKVNFRTLNGY